jgi:hypothetical protein
MGIIYCLHRAEKKLAKDVNILSVPIVFFSKLIIMDGGTDEQWYNFMSILHAFSALRSVGNYVNCLYNSANQTGEVAGINLLTKFVTIYDILMKER